MMLMSILIGHPFSLSVSVSSQCFIISLEYITMYHRYPQYPYTTAARVIVNIAILKLAETHVYDVPFNMGTNRDSQGVIEAVRKNPTGWTGMYANLLKSIPPLPEDAGRSEL